MFYGQMLGCVQYGLSGTDLAVRVQVLDARITPAMKDWPDTSMDIMASMPGSKTVRQVVFLPKIAAGGRVTLHENGTELPDPQVRWQVAPLPDAGYVITALIPLSVLEIDPGSQRFLLECAVCAVPASGGPAQYVPLFHSYAGFMNNARFGHMVVE